MMNWWYKGGILCFVSGIIEIFVLLLIYVECINKFDIVINYENSILK